MQKVSLQERSTSICYTERENEDILHFSLQGALPPGHLLTLNMVLGTLSALSFNDEQPRLVMQQQFSGSELSLLRPLLESFPQYCPYEQMFASFYNNDVTESIVAHWHQHLQEAREEGIWEHEMKPIRNVLSRVRLKLRKFGIHISSVLEMGYILMVVSTPGPGEE